MEGDGWAREGEGERKVGADGGKESESDQRRARQKKETATHLDALVMQLQQELDPRIECLLGLVGGINVARLPTLHVPLLMIHRRINDAVPDGLGHNVLCVLLRVEGQLGRNVREGDARIGEREGAEGSFDDVVAEAEDEGGGGVGGEGRRVGRESRVEGVDVADADGCREGSEKGGDEALKVRERWETGRTRGEMEG